MATVNCPRCGGVLELSAARPPVPVPAQSAPTKTAAKQEIKEVTCSRCGQGGLCWQQSRAGKWYLCSIRDGQADRRAFHTCQPKADSALDSTYIGPEDIPF